MKKLLFLLVALLCISLGKAQVTILRNPATRVINQDTAARTIHRVTDARVISQDTAARAIHPVTDTRVINQDTATNPANKGIGGRLEKKPHNIGDPYKIGDHIQGGVVFYIDESGQHGLVAATEDQSEGIQWYNGNHVVANPVRNNGIGMGRNNTDVIIATQGRGNYAAFICAKYMGGGFGDWYLPSIHELSLLHVQRRVVGGFSSGIYWSSSEVDNHDAWIRVFSDAFARLTATKNATHYVRAVRAF